MSKKNKQGSKREQRLEIANPLAEKIAKGSSRRIPGSKPMLIGGRISQTLSLLLPRISGRRIMTSGYGTNFVCARRDQEKN